MKENILAVIEKNSSGVSGIFIPYLFTNLLDQYNFTVTENQNLKASPFLIVRSLQNKKGQSSGVPLAIGDIIRLGSCQFLIKEIGLANGVKRK